MSSPVCYTRLAKCGIDKVSLALGTNLTEYLNFSFMVSFNKHITENS